MPSLLYESGSEILTAEFDGPLPLCQGEPMRRIAAFLTLVLFVVGTTAPALACLAQVASTACCCKATTGTATAICPVDCCSPGRASPPRQNHNPQNLLLRLSTFSLLTLATPQDWVLLPRVTHRPSIHSLAPPLRLRI